MLLVSIAISNYAYEVQKVQKQDIQILKTLESKLYKLAFNKPKQSITKVFNFIWANRINTRYTPLKITIESQFGKRQRNDRAF